MPLKGFCLYFALLGLMQTTTSVVVMIVSAFWLTRLTGSGMVVAGVLFWPFLQFGLAFSCSALPGPWRRRAKIRKTNGEKSL